MRTSLLPALPGLAAAAALAAGACGNGGGADLDAAPRPDAATIDAGPDGAIGPDAAVAACEPRAGATIATEITLPPGTFTRPLLVTAPPGDRRMFVIEQAGRIRIVDDGAVRPTPFLDVSQDAGGPVRDTGNEQGLLGLAFHPAYADNGKLYVYYTRRPDNALEIAEYQRRPDGDTADPDSARVLITIPHPSFTNHNGGMLAFGPDGYLYAGTGDGGSGGDPSNNGQNLGSLLGKLIRIDVDTTTGELPYGIPASNPFVGQQGARAEIWAYGLRNPWRWSFDPANGDLWLGDVGQNAREELNRVPGTSTGGENYGWRVIEGFRCYPNGGSCNTDGMTPPVHDYPTGQGQWCSIIGGAVYRGSCFPDLVGTYVYGDYCHRRIWALTAASPGDHRAVTNALPAGITGIHPDATGELYVTLMDGSVRRIVAGP